MRKISLLLLVSPRHGRAGPPGNERLTLGPNSITRDASSWHEPCPYPRCRGTTSREATLGEEPGMGGQGQAFQGHQGDL